MAIGTALFTGDGHRMLPREVKLCSWGLASVVVMFFAASLLRHWWVLDNGLAYAAGGAVIYLCLLLAIFAARPDHLALFVCSSAGVDLIVAAAAAAGLVDGNDSTLRMTTLAWEVVAFVVAMLGRARGAQTEGSA